MEMEHLRESAFTSALFIYMTAVVILITLIPFTFRIPAGFHVGWSTDAPDMITNVFLFLPVGFLFRLSRGKNRDRFCVKTLGLGILLSAAIEFTQIFIPGRYCSVVDVVTNGLGAWLGAVVYGLLAGGSKEEYPIRLFSLELPLMNVVYLLIPLMWLNGLSTGSESARLVLLLLLALFGSGVLVSVCVHRLEQDARFTPNKLSFFAASWFVVASLPSLTNFPWETAGIGIVIAVLVQVPARLLIHRETAEMRFELSTLRVLMPLYGIYLLLLALWPTTVPFQNWEVGMHFQELAFNQRIVFTFRFIEVIGAFTLFGYMLAEMRGRKRESGAAALGWTFPLALGCSAAFVAARSYPPLLGSDILETLLMTGAAMYGGVIYRLQLAAIRP